MRPNPLRRILVTEFLLAYGGVEAPWVPLLADNVAQRLSKGENIKALAGRLGRGGQICGIPRRNQLHRKTALAFRKCRKTPTRPR